MNGPDPNAIHPNAAIRQVVYLKNVITRPTILVGDYTYYDDVDGAERFEEHVTHHYDFLGDRLIIGKFCAIGRGVEFIMNGANHRMGSATTYPFHTFCHCWEGSAPARDELPLKGDTVVGNDVWFGQDVTVLPGVHIGDGAIIGARSVVGRDVPPYAIAVGDPCRVVRMRFDQALIDRLLALRWWDRDITWITQHLDILCSSDPTRIWEIED